VCQCVTTYAKIFIVNVFHFSLSSVFYSLAVKFIILNNKIGFYKVKLHGHWEIEEFNLGAFMLKFSLPPHV
jgi:hypothetical protein